MSWVKTDEDSGNSISFTCWRCKVCRRQAVTTGSVPSTNCVCSPAPHAKKRVTSGLKGRR